MKAGDIVLYRGGGPWGALTRLATRAAVGHAAIVAPDGRHVIAAEGDGVRLEPLPDPADPGIWVFPIADAAAGLRAADVAATQIGDAYDYAAYLPILARVITAVTPPTRLRPHAFICSALAVWCWREAGVDPVPGKATRTVTPADLFDALARLPGGAERAAPLTVGDAVPAEAAV